MRKSMKQRVALFLSFAMAFTSVDSSVLVAASDVTEVVSEETHDHDHEEEQTALQVEEAQPDTGEEVLAEEDEDISLETEVDSDIAEEGLDAEVYSGEGEQILDEEVVSLSETEDSEKMETDIVSESTTQSTIASISVVPESIERPYISGLDHYVVNGSKMTITYADGTTYKTTIYSYSNQITDEQDHTLSLYFRSIADESIEYDACTYNMPVGTYDLVLKENDATYTTGATYQIADIEDITLPELQVGEIEVSSGQNRMNMYRFTAPETGKYWVKKVNSMSVYRKTENGLNFISNQQFEAEKGETYYIGFMSGLWDEENKQEEYFWTTELAAVKKKVASAELISTFNTQYIEGLHNYVGHQVTLLLTYTDDSTEELKSRGSGVTLSASGNSIDIELKKADGSSISSYEPPAGTYGITVTADGEEVLNLDGVFTVGAATEINLPELTTGPNSIQSGQYETKWYQFTAPKTATYTFSENVQYWYVRTETGVKSLNYGGGALNAIAGTTYYAGFSGDFWDPATQTRRYETVLDVSKRPEIESITAGELYKTEYISGVDDTYINSIELQITYDTGETKNMHLSGNGSYDGNGNNIKLKWKSQESGKEYSSGEILPAGNYVIAFYVNDKAYGTSTDIATVRSLAEVYKGDLAEGKNTIRTTKDGAYNWYRFVAPETGRYRFSRANSMSVYQQKENAIDYISNFDRSFKAIKGNTYYIGFCGAIYDEDEEEVYTWTTVLSRGLYVKSMEVVPAKTSFYSGRYTNFVQLAELKVTYNDDTIVTLKNIRGGSSIDDYGNYISAKITSIDDEDSHYGSSGNFSAGNYMVRVIMEDDEIGAEPYQITVEEEPTPFNGKANVTAIELGKEYSIALTKTMPYGWFSYTPESNQRIVYREKGQEYCEARIFDKDGKRIGNDWGENVNEPVTLNAGDIYYFETILPEQADENDTRTVWIIEALDIQNLEVLETDLKQVYLPDESKPAPYVLAKATYKDGTSQEIKRNGSDDFGNRIQGEILDTTGNVVTKCSEPGTYTYQIRSGEATATVGTFEVKNVEDLANTDVSDGEQQIDATDSNKMSYQFKIAEEGIYQLNANVPFESLRIYTQEKELKRVLSGRTYTAYVALEPGTYYVTGDVDSQISKLKVSVKKVILPEKAEVYVSRDNLIAGVDDLDTSNCSTKVSYTDQTQTWIYGEKGDTYGNRFDYQLKDEKGNEWGFYEELPAGTYTVKPVVFRTGTWAGNDESADNQLLNKALKEENKKSATLHIVKPDVSSMTAIEENQNVVVSGNSRRVFYTFTPEEDGDYVVKYENKTVNNVVFLANGKDRFDMIGNSMHGKAGTTYVVMANRYSDFSFRIEKEGTDQNKLSVKEFKVVSNKKTFYYGDSDDPYDWHDDIWRYYLDVTYENAEKVLIYMDGWTYDRSEITLTDDYGNTFMLTCKLTDEKVKDQYTVTAVCGDKSSSETMKYVSVDDHATALKVGEEKQSNAEQLYSFTPQETGEYTFRIIAKDWGVELGQFVNWVNLKKELRIESAGSVTAVASAQLRKGKTYYFDVVDNRENKSDTSYKIMVLKPEKKIADVQIVDAEKNLKVYKGIGVSNLYNLQAKIVYADGTEKTISQEEIDEDGRFLSVVNTYWVNTETYRVIVSFGKYRAYVDLAAQPWDNSQELQLAKAVAGRTDTDVSLYTFTPAKSGTYQFKVEGIAQWAAEVYDSKTGKQVSPWYGVLELQSGTTYNVAIYNYYHAGDAFTVTINKENETEEHVHSYVEDTKEATCEEAGYTQQKCSTCGEIKSGSYKEITALGHDWQEIVIEEATATKDGIKALACSRCQKEKENSREPIPMTGHKMGDWTVTKEPTCTEDGIRTRKCENTNCSICNGTPYVETELVSATGHTFGAWSITKAATCTEKGTMTRSCSVCRKEESAAIPALGHQYEEEKEEATCTKAGYTQKKCSVCDDVTDRVEIPALSHAYGEWSISKAATCTEAGERVKVCNICGDKQSETIPTTGHNYTTDSKAATCIEAGYTQEKCTVCGNIKDGSREEISALGHTYGDKVITKAATCTENGTYTQTCTRCGNKITGLEPMKGHTFKEDKKEPTCEETGYTQNICEVCGTIEDYTLIPAKGHTYETKVIKAATDTTEGEQADFCTVCEKEKPGSRTIIPMTAHQMGDWEVTKEATCTEEGSRERTCVYENCTLCKDGERYTQTETIAKLPHSYKEEKKEATCTTAGYTQLVCENCKEVKEGSYKKLEATGHIFGAGKITLEPTCTSQGLITFTCTKCDAKRIGVLPEKDHAWNSTPTIEKQATCSTEGEQDIRCKDCNAVKEGSTTTIPKLAHQWSDEVTIDKQATCAEDGQQSIHCNNCNAILEGSVAVISATGHQYAEKLTPATCTSNGKIEKECTVCGDKQTEVLGKLGHKMQLDTINSTAANCTDDGLLVYTCQNDGCGKKEYATQSALEHNWNEAKTKEATEEANGKVYKVCSRCGEEEIVSILPRKAQQTLIDTAKADTTSTAEAIEAITRIDNEILLDNTTENLVEKVEQKLLENGVGDTTYKKTTVGGDLSDITSQVTGATITAATNGNNSQSMLATFALDNIATYADNSVTSTVTVNKGNTGKTEAGKAYMDMRLSMTVDSNPVTTLAAPITLTLTAPETYRGTNATVTTLSGNKQKITVAENGTFTFTTAELGTVRLTVESCTGAHVWDSAKATKATCTEAATQTCGKCGKKEVSTKELATGHNYSVVVDTKEATCKEAGSQTLKCANCNATTTKELPVSKIHTYTKWTTDQAATCTINGVETSACDVCGNKTERVLKATGHKFADTYTIDEEARCDKVGTESRHCENCDAKTDITEIAKTEHTFPTVDDPNVTWTLATSCSEKDTATVTCTVCKEATKTLTRTASNPSAHNWDETKTVRDESTCTTAGSETKTCADCGTTVTTPLALKPHTLTKTEAKAATCVADGNKEYWTCSECHQIFSDANGKNVTTTAQVTVKATGKHNKVTVIDRQPTCGAAGSQHLECSICHAKDPATSIPATGKHSFGEYKVTKEATVQAAGTKTRTCSVCGKTETQAIAKLPGSVALTTGKLPLQLKKTVQLSKILTGTAEGDYIASCASANTKVATVNASGKVTAKAAGSAVITITMASGATAKVTVAVQKKAVATASIKNVEKKWNAKQGEKKQLRPVISPVSTLDKVTYTSSNKKVATVSKSGLITAKKSGTAKITVKSGKKKVTVTVKVAKAAPTGIKGVAATKTLKKGKSFTIKAKLTPSGAEAKISFKSSNKKVATVNAKGKVTAKGPGTAVITVKAGNITKTCTITVK